MSPYRSLVPHVQGISDKCDNKRRNKIFLQVPEYEDYGWTPPPQVKVSDQSCNPYGQFAVLPGIGNLTDCVAINKCYDLLDANDAPLSRLITCGFDEKENLMMICCPTEKVTEPQVGDFLLEDISSIHFFSSPRK